MTGHDKHLDLEPPESEASCTVIGNTKHFAVFAQPAPQNLTCSSCSTKRSSRGAGDFPFPLLANVWCTAGSMARPSSCCLSAPAPAYAGKKTVRHCLRRPACSVWGSKWATSSCASTCRRSVKDNPASFTSRSWRLLVQSAGRHVNTSTAAADGPLSGSQVGPKGAQPAPAGNVQQ